MVAALALDMSCAFVRFPNGFGTNAQRTSSNHQGTTIVFATQFTGLIKRFPYRVVPILNGRVSNGKKVDTNEAREVKAGE